MKAKLVSAFGYQGDAMNLPVADVDSALPYYVDGMGFQVVEQTDEPHKKAVLERGGIRIGLAENGGGPEQDGCAFHTDHIIALRDEFVGRGLEKIGQINTEERKDGSRFKAFFVIAPDGLC